MLKQFNKKKEEYVKKMNTVYEGSRECTKSIYDPCLLIIDLKMSGNFMYQFVVTVDDIAKISEIYFVLNNNIIPTTWESIGYNQYVLNLFREKEFALPVRYIPLCNALLHIRVTDPAYKDRITVDSKRVYCDDQDLDKKQFIIPTGSSCIVVMHGFASYVDDANIPEGSSALDMLVSSTI